MNKEKVLCYVAVDDMGNIIGAVVHEDEFPQRTAIHLADWIMHGLHIMPMAVEDVRVSLGYEFAGPRIKPNPPHHIRIVTRDEQGNLISECEGDEELLEEYNDESPRSSRKSYDDDESYMEAERRQKREEEEMAFDILDTLCAGSKVWKHVRTLGDFDTLRRQIAGVQS
jgi:hypothetical protein